MDKDEIIEEIELVHIKETQVNTKTHKTYGNQDQKVLRKYLKARYKNQGDLYKKVFGVSFDDATLAGWEPAEWMFSKYCRGWMRFLKDKGMIKKCTTTKIVPVSSILFEEGVNYE